MSTVDILTAVKLIARLLGPKPGTLKLVRDVVEATFRSPSAIRERLLNLLAFCVLKAGTERPKLDHRGDVLVAVEAKPDPAHPNMPVLVTTHQRRYRVSVDVAKERGLRLHPRILDNEERRELRVVLLAVRWGESVGLFETGMTVRDDQSLEVGLKPTGIAGKLEDTELYQFRHDKTSDLTRERWWYVLERDRTRRGVPFTVVSRHEGKDGPETRIEIGGEMIEYPIHDLYARPKGGTVLRESGVARYPWDPNDPADRAEEDNATSGLQPLRRPTLEDNQLLRRERYRLGWNIGAWRWDGKIFHHISKDKVILLSNGDLWTPKDDAGNPEQDYFGDVRETLSWWDKQDRKRITVKRWRKTAFRRHELEFVVPEIKPDETIGWTTVKGGCLGAEEANRLAARKDVIVRRNAVVTAELEGLMRAAVENPAYDAVEYVPKTYGFGASEILEAPCKRCSEKWGFNDPKIWAAKPHAHICNLCGAEVWRVMARVYISKKEFPFLRLPINCTHISAEVFGPWITERLRKGAKPGVTYVANRELLKS